MASNFGIPIAELCEEAAEARELAAMLDAIPDVRRTSLLEESASGRGADIVHRPFQIESPADLAMLASLGERLVITQQDLIGYHNPSYFPSEAGWRGYQALTTRRSAEPPLTAPRKKSATGLPLLPLGELVAEPSKL